MNRLPNPISIVAFVILGCSIAGAQANTAGEQGSAAAPAPAPSPMFVKGVAVYTSKGTWCPDPNHPDVPCVAGIGDKVIVEVGNLEENVKAGLKPSELVIFLNDQPLSGVNGTPSGSAASNWLAFDLKRTEGSSQAWGTLLGRPGFEHLRKATVSVGKADQQEFPGPANPKLPLEAPKLPVISLRLYHRGWAIFAAIALLLTLGFFFYLAKRTGIIRDSGPAQVTSTTRPYSLARVQAAFWFFLVIGSFIFLYLITGDYNTITDQALILMGIGTGTALGAAMIDANKNDSANGDLNDLRPQQARLQTEISELNQQVTSLTATIAGAGAAATAEDKQSLSAAKTSLSEKNAQLTELTNKINDAASGLTKPVTEGFRKDLLTDANGTNFHRFQMLAWTIVLGFLFIAGVYQTLGMPQFSGTLLALMGISAGTYLGFKIPEQQS